VDLRNNSGLTTDRDNTAGGVWVRYAGRRIFIILDDALENSAIGISLNQGADRLDADFTTASATYVSVGSTFATPAIVAKWDGALYIHGQATVSHDTTNGQVHLGVWKNATIPTQGGAVAGTQLVESKAIVPVIGADVTVPFFYRDDRTYPDVSTLTRFYVGIKTPVGSATIRGSSLAVSYITVIEA